LPRDPDPIVETRTVVQRACPPELLAAPPQRPARPAGGAITGDPATLAWIGQLSRWGDTLAALFADAAGQCS
jgi:hypothetical protein